jgi:L-malate glycosyltransferase
MSGTSNPRRLRVLLVGPSLDILGGQAVHLARLLPGLRGIPSLDAHFLPVNPRLPGPLRALQRIKYVRTVVTSLAYLVSLFRVLRRFDVVHAYSASYWSFLLAPVPAMLVARLYGKAVVLNYHSGEADDHLRRSRRTVLPLLRLAHLIVVPSRYLVDVFASHGVRAIAVHNHLDPDEAPYQLRTTFAPRFISNRNLEPLYDVATTLRAFGIIQRAHPGASLVVAGDGSARAALEALSRELGLVNVEFRGRVAPEQMGALLQDADVYLNASKIDNMPISILESFLAGLPVVTTNAGGIPYIVRHEDNGLVVSMGDADALAAAALRVLDDPASAARLAAQARDEAMSSYVWPAVRDQWERAYQRAAASAGIVPSLGAGGSAAASSSLGDPTARSVR